MTADRDRRGKPTARTSLTQALVARACFTNDGEHFHWSSDSLDSRAPQGRAENHHISLCTAVTITLRTAENTWQGNAGSDPPSSFPLPPATQNDVGYQRPLRSTRVRAKEVKPVLIQSSVSHLHSRFISERHPGEFPNSVTAVQQNQPPWTKVPPVRGEQPGARQGFASRAFQ